MKERATSTSVDRNLHKKLHRAAILELLRERETISRSQIARSLRISPATVTRITQELLLASLIIEVGQADSTGGRRPTLLAFNFEENAIISIDLGDTESIGVLADLRGTIKHQSTFLLTNPPDVDANIGNLIRTVAELFERAAQARLTVLGVGIGVPSIVHREQGLVVWAPSLGWRNLPLREMLEKKFSTPIFVENDINLAALGEFWYGREQNVKNLVCITIGTGVGAGIIINGELYRGVGEAAGEVGYLLPDASFLGKHRDGYGALESLTTGLGIIGQVRDLMPDHPDSMLWDLCAGDLDNLRANHVMEAARSGDSLALSIVERVVDLLSLLVANVSAVVNPELIILKGYIERYPELFMPSIVERIKGTIPQVPRVIASEHGNKAAVMGAALLVLYGTDEYVYIRRKE
jgi:glucokinase